MAWTQADLTAIDQKIASGVRSVTFSDNRQVTYRTMDEMLKARALIVEQVAATGGTPRIRRRRMVASKGL